MRLQPGQEAAYIPRAMTTKISTPRVFFLSCEKTGWELTSSANWRAVLRIKAVCRLRCCALLFCGFREGGREATKISTPLPQPRGFPELREARLGAD